MNLCHLFLNARNKYRDNIAIIDNQTHTTVTFNDIFCHFSHMAHFLNSIILFRAVKSRFCLILTVRVYYWIMPSWSPDAQKSR